MRGWPNGQQGNLALEAAAINFITPGHNKLECFAQIKISFPNVTLQDKLESYLCQNDLNLSFVVALALYNRISKVENLFGGSNALAYFGVKKP